MQSAQANPKIKSEHFVGDQRVTISVRWLTVIMPLIVAIGSAIISGYVSTQVTTIKINYLEKQLERVIKKVDTIEHHLIKP